MSMLLEKENLSVATNCNGEEIFAAITQARPEIILLDISMNKVHGGDLCRKLKEAKETAHIPLLMFSSNRNIAEVATDCGADGFIPKSATAAEIKKAISDCLANTAE